MSDKNDLGNTLGSHATYSWIGLRRGNTHRWIWSDGRGPAHYTRWKVGEPNSGGVSEPCGEMQVGGTWNDAPCGYENYFACYETRADGTETFVFYSGGRTWLESQERCRTKHTDLAYISKQGRWVGADCNKKSAFVCQGDLKVKKTVIRMTVRSDVDLTDSTISDALMEKLKVSLAQQGITDVNLSWRRDSSGLAFQRHKVP
ncbi:hypothetical protein JOQ06_020735 [Pogonophryne albipinna]|uniref:C-type lectin domain-containing protein n=1 Tax=Pogonophryne albipinna TaxID=1090488 RepID=A0AAD6FV91_9TELE|nr:hypothetical protein JOQ06_020735 [Pogonophryne albipinna]